MWATILVRTRQLPRRAGRKVRPARSHRSLEAHGRTFDLAGVRGERPGRGLQPVQRRLLPWCAGRKTRSARRAGQRARPAGSLRSPRRWTRKHTARPRQPPLRAGRTARARAHLPRESCDGVYLAGLSGAPRRPSRHTGWRAEGLSGSSLPSSNARGSEGTSGLNSPSAAHGAKGKTGLTSRSSAASGAEDTIGLNSPASAAHGAEGTTDSKSPSSAGRGVDVRTDSTARRRQPLRHAGPKARLA